MNYIEINGRIEVGITIEQRMMQVSYYQLLRASEKKMYLSYNSDAITYVSSLTPIHNISAVKNNYSLREVSVTFGLTKVVAERVGPKWAPKSMEQRY